MSRDPLVLDVVFILHVSKGLIYVASLSVVVHPCSWYTNHLTLHGLRKVLHLRHGYPVCQANEVCVDDLECPLRIHTHNLIASLLSSMTRKAL